MAKVMNAGSASAFFVKPGLAKADHGADLCERRLRGGHCWAPASLIEKECGPAASKELLPDLPIRVELSGG